MESQRNKSKLRIRMRTLRHTLSSARRQTAAENLIEIADRTDRPILSYASFADELDTWFLNHLLAKQSKLLLPKVVKETLSVYRVNDIKKQLKPNSWGILEPIPELCEEIDPALLTLALVPGIAFDKMNHRLGYGKGYYDHFLRLLPCHKIGIGFQEQFVEELIPVESHDIPLNALSLY